jgi:hypothetical protein
MPLSSHRDERGFMRIVMQGRWPSLSEIIELYQSIGDIHKVRLVLIDIRDATGPLPRYPDIRETVSALDQPSTGARERKRAVLVSSDVQFGVARTFQAIAPGQMEIFRDESTALAWLLL